VKLVGVEGGGRGTAAAAADFSAAAEFQKRVSRIRRAENFFGRQLFRNRISKTLLQQSFLQAAANSSNSSKQKEVDRTNPFC
jgi:hypothetical protein